MKVLLLAAGRSKRLKPVEDKNFLKFLGKPLIWHQIEQLHKASLKDLIVVGGKHNLARLKVLAGELGKIARDLRFKIVEQKDLEAGMAGAILAAEKLIGKGPVFIVSANDVVDGEAYRLVLQATKDKRFDSLIIGKKVTSYFPGGYLKVRYGGLLTGIVEKPGEGKEPSKMVNLVLHYHRDAGRLIKELHRTGSAIASVRDDRYEAALDRLIKSGLKMKALPYNGFWQAVKYPWHVISLMNRFLENMQHGGTTQIGGAAAKVIGTTGAKRKIPKTVRCGINVIIAESAIVRGEVFLDDNAMVLENAVIIGPAYIGKNSIVATNVLVRASQIGDNCVIGFGSEVARSYVGDNVWTHTNYIGDSVIGNNCSFGAGTVTGNLRLDEANIAVNIGGWDKGGGEKICSGTNKFGLVTGDNVRCGINTSFMPGVKIGNNCFIGAGIIVAQDIEDDKFVYGKTELMIKDNIRKADLGKRNEMKKSLSKPKAHPLK